MHNVGGEFCLAEYGASAVAHHRIVKESGVLFVQEWPRVTGHSLPELIRNLSVFMNRMGVYPIYC